MTLTVHLCIWWTLFAGGVNVVEAFTRTPDRWSLAYLLVGIGLIVAGGLSL